MSEPYCPLEVGMKVVCVDSMPREVLTFGNLIEGDVYTITKIWKNDRDEIGVKVAEAEPVKPCLGFHADRFRPVRDVDTTKEVEALKKIVRDVLEGVRA